MKKILITGITGQDGIFLTKQLLINEPETEIYGTTRNANHNYFLNQLSSIGLENNYNLKLINIDLENFDDVNNLISDIKPSTIYNLAGPSSVYGSLKLPYVEHTIINIFSNLIESLIKNNHLSYFFQASSSEMFKESTSKLNEDSDLSPNSPYAKAKLFCHEKSIELREKYDWPIISGILFNHESQFREKEFLFSKIVDSAIGISQKKTQQLIIGSLDLERDWSYAEDVVKGLYQITNVGESHTYVIGSGVSTSIKEVVQTAFSYFDLNYEDFIEIDSKLLRKGDPQKKVADISKIQNEINWEPKVTVKNLIELIIESRLKHSKF